MCALKILKQKLLKTRKTFQLRIFTPAEFACVLALSSNTGLTESECVMNKPTTDAPRKIIENFAADIKKRALPGAKPEKAVIDFRNDRTTGWQRDILFVPIDFLRYRKDNGRIASDVLSHERNHGRLDEESEDAQKIIRGFLEENDKDKTEELKRSIVHEDQREPAIITCDGFLINGNRRKMVFEMLSRETRDAKFSTMKVVILPGEGDPGGPPTLKQIEQIENRYQLQSDGKAEYYDFNKALSMQRKIKYGMSLEEQLKDDPQYAHLNNKEFERAVEKVRNEFLNPLECIDRYLETLGRDGLYNTVSTGLGDPEGRWQAFRDYYQFVYKKLKDPEELLKMKLRHDEVGKVEDVAFKLIRKREFGKIGISKVHNLMREMPSLLKNEQAKRELLKINQIKDDVPKEIAFADGKELSERQKDKAWGEHNSTHLFRHVNAARTHHTSKVERETVLHLLQVALDKLQHEDMDLTKIDAFEYKTAMKLTQEIQRVAKELERDFYKLEKDKDSLPTKK
jgi:hypothetical protein